MSVSVKMVGGNVKQAGLSLTSKLAYGCGDAGCNVVWGAMSAWLMLWIIRNQNMGKHGLGY